ncbi:nitroreductase family protein [Microbacterium koreense]|uniref:Nitroreductase family protein n=1 Tax=Microbacterium koreense TaxID=323761 RepID=A0ABW2ZQN4_9MICO
MTPTATSTPASPSLTARYAAPPTVPADVLTEVIAQQLRHHSVRRFASTDVGEHEMTAIIAAAQSASTSSNMQSWSVIEIRDPQRKHDAATLSGDQDFIRQAPVFLVFVADLARNRAVAERAGGTTTATEYMESTLIGFVDAALAAQNAALAAESLGLGITFVGSARNNPHELAELLELPHGVFPVAGMAIGHPHADEAAGVKPRLPQAVVRHRETYRPSTGDDIAAYDATVAEYHSSQGRPSDWADKIRVLVRDAGSLRGRETIRDDLARRGFPSR